MDRITSPHTHDGNCPVCHGSCGSNTPFDEAHSLGDFDGRSSVTLAEIHQQREKHWADFHPEDFCHRCGGRNLSWWIDSDVWNTVMRPAGIDSPWMWNEIICPACFADLFEGLYGGASFRFSLDMNTRGAKAFAADQHAEV